jgi:glycosyltransferase involved in cell wall biosynthesis
MKRERISVVVLTQNNSSTIERCLSSLSFADEIIVVDSFSEDNTVKLCKRFGAKVFSKKFVCTAFSRNFGLEKSKNNWVFFIDSDEKASVALASSLKSFFPSAGISACSVFIKTNYLGKWMNSAALSQWQPRLFKKGSAFWSKRLCHAPPTIVGKTFPINGNLKHYSIQTVSEHFRKLFYYTSLEAKQRAIQKDSDFLLFFPLRLMIDVCYVFLKRLFYEFAFLDGWRGIVFSVISAFYECVVNFKFFFKKY